jgi:hypothetical protein
MNATAMATYRIHRLKNHLRQSFRFGPHVSGTANVKPRDYEPGAAVDGATPYAVFFAMRDSGTPLEIGDLLEGDDGRLTIFKYVGFEDAQWTAPETKPEPALQ